MSLSLENWFGLAGSLFLLFAPARDQLLRVRSAYYATRNRRHKDTEGYWKLILEGFESQRNRWNVWDSLTMALGAALIGLSYVV